jgi:predicted acetyltransferase
MTIEIRTIRPEDELLSWLDAQTTAFLERGIDIAKVAEEVREHWDFSRIWGAIEGSRVVGTTRTYATELTVPGNRQVKASAVTQVAVRPTHRRRGLLRGMLDAEHAAARERGEIVSILFASESGIYGRFGYGVSTETADWSIDTRETAFTDAAGGMTGSVELLDIDDAAVDQARAIYEAARRVQPGEIWRRPITWKSDFGLAGRAWGETWKGFLAVHRDPEGVPDGYARYQAESKWENHQLQGTAKVNDLHALTQDAEVALLRFLFDIDLVRTVRLEARTPTERLPWFLTNPRAAHVVEAGQGMWARLHDVPAALEARTYETTGAVVLEVVGGEAERPPRVALEASPDGARAVSTDRAAELTIDAAALGAAYLGGSRLRDAVLARGADEHRTGALAEADRLLACRDAPWCSTFF